MRLELPKELIVNFASSSEIAIQPIKIQDSVVLSKDPFDYISASASAAAFLISAFTLLWSILQNRKQTKFQANLRRDEFLTIPTISEAQGDHISIHKSNQAGTIGFYVTLNNSLDDEKKLQIQIQNVKLNNTLLNLVLWSQVSEKEYEEKINTSVIEGSQTNFKLTFKNIENDLIESENKLEIKYQDIFKRNHSLIVNLTSIKTGEEIYQKKFLVNNIENILNKDDK